MRNSGDSATMFSLLEFGLRGNDAGSQQTAIGGRRGVCTARDADEVPARAGFGRRHPSRSRLLDPVMNPMGDGIMHIIDEAGLGLMKLLEENDSLRRENEVLGQQLAEQHPNAS